MTARFFGEYLVQKGVIDSRALVSVLIEQMNLLPLVGQVVFEHELLTPDEILKIFHEQQIKGIDFVQASRELGFWSEELSEKIHDQLNKQRTPIGQILVERGYLDLKALTRSLDDYLAEARVPGVNEIVASGDTSSPLEGALSAPVLMTADELAELDDMFNERKRKAVKVALAFIKDKNPPDSVQLTKLMQDCLKIIRSILGMLKLMGIVGLQSIFEEMERVLSLKMNASLFPLEEMQDVASRLSDALDEAWNLREHILKHQSESSYMIDKNLRSRFENVISKLKDIQ